MTGILSILWIVAAQAQTHDWEAEVAALDIENGVGDVTLAVGGDHISVEVDVKKGECDVVFGGTSKASVEVKNPKRRGECEADVSVTMPAANALSLQLGVGDVTFAGLRGPVDVELGVGDLQLDIAAGHIRVGAGSVAGTAGVLDLEIGAGNADLSGLCCEVKVTVGAGNVDLVFASAPDGVIDANVGVGNVEITLPEGTDVDVAANNANVTASQKQGAKTRVTSQVGIGNVRIK